MYQAQGNSTREILRQATGMVVTELGEGWAVDVEKTETHGGAVYVNGPDGMGLYFRATGDLNSRIAISGDYQVDRRGNVNWHMVPDSVSITVARERGPAVIAREIERRLIPTYRERLAAYRAALDDERARQDHAAQLRADLAKRSGGTVVNMGRVVMRPGGNYLGEFEVPEHGGGVSVEIRWITDDQARALADFLKTL